MLDSTGQTDIPDGPADARVFASGLLLFCFHGPRRDPMWPGASSRGPRKWDEGPEEKRKGKEDEALHRTIYSMMRQAIGVSRHRRATETVASQKFRSPGIKMQIRWTAWFCMGEPIPALGIAEVKIL